MATAAPGSSSVWARLRHNGELNAPVFFAAGILTEKITPVKCRTCGTVENGLFWTLVSRDGNLLRLRCPSCEKYTLRYDLSTNQVTLPWYLRVRFFTLPLAAVLVTVAALTWFSDALPISAAVERFHALRAALSGSAAEQAQALSERTSAPPQIRASAGAVSENLPTPAAPALAGRPAPANRAALVAWVWAERPRPESLSGLAAGGTSAFVLVAAGDRRGEIERELLEMAPAGADPGVTGLRNVHYDPATNQTYVVVDTASVEWLRRLQHWRQARE